MCMLICLYNIKLFYQFLWTVHCSEIFKKNSTKVMTEEWKMFLRYFACIEFCLQSMTEDLNSIICSSIIESQLITNSQMIWLKILSKNARCWIFVFPNFLHHVTGYTKLVDGSEQVIIQSYAILLRGLGNCARLPCNYLYFSVLWVLNV